MKPIYIIEWSYPTSPNAEQFGFAKTGCWTVSMYNKPNPPIPVAGFATREEAEAKKERMDKGRV